MWAHTRNGDFTIKSAYRQYMNENITLEDAQFWSRVWEVDCLSKIKFFLWKIFAQLLPVNSLLQFCNSHVDYKCPLCHNHEEIVMHLFVSCPIASHIWFWVSLQHLITTDLECIDDIFLFSHDTTLIIFPFTITIDLNKAIVEIRRMINTYIVPLIRSSKVNREIKVSVQM